MAGVWDSDLERFVITGGYTDSWNLNTHEYDRVYIHQKFVAKITDLSPNTNYTLRVQRGGMNANYFSNNQGWNDCCTEEDLTDWFWWNNFTGGQVAFTSDSAGNAEVELTPTNAWICWEWGASGLGFPNAGSPSLGDNLMLTQNNISFKGFRGWGTTDRGVAVWDSISRYNPVPKGYHVGDGDNLGRYFTFFDRVATFELDVIGSGLPTTKTTVNATYRMAFQVGGNDYPQNSDTDFSDPQIEIPTTLITGQTLVQEFDPTPCYGGGDNSEYSDEIIQRFVTNPTNKNQYIECLEISHPDIEQTFYLVNDRIPHDLTLDDGSVQTFQPYGFAVNLPQTDRGGIKDMNVTVDNTDRILTQFIEDAKQYENTMELTYRIYTADDPTTNHLTPPFKMSLTDIQVNTFQVAGKARFIDSVNSTFLRDDYDRKRFPSLGS